MLIDARGEQIESGRDKDENDDQDGNDRTDLFAAIVAVLDRGHAIAVCRRVARHGIHGLLVVVVHRWNLVINYMALGEVVLVSMGVEVETGGVEVETGGVVVP